MQKIFILGSTGSIGSQTLEIIEKNKDKFDLIGISCHSSVHKFIEQILQFRPKYAIMQDERLIESVKTKTNHTGCKFISGIDCYKKFTQEVNEIDCLVSAISSSRGISPTFSLLNKTKILAIANKESIICTGKILINKAKELNVKMIPIDSEHNSIYQIIEGEKKENIKKITITASGGSFFGKSKSELENITPSDAAKHPNWQMGIKNTIDSNTMANKAIELIEAAILFDLQPKQIDAVIQRTQIAHAIVETIDSGVKIFASNPDMKLHIANAIGNGEKSIKSNTKPLDFSTSFSLDFSPIPKDFKAFFLGKWALKNGQISQCVFNFANEIAVEKFINSQIKFTQIPDLIEKTLEHDFKIEKLNTIEDVLDFQKNVWNYCRNLSL